MNDELPKEFLIQKKKKKKNCLKNYKKNTKFYIQRDKDSINIGI